MLERPAGVADDDVLAVVRREWAAGAGVIEHLRIGFGAHHWRAGSLFVTLDGSPSRWRPDAAMLELYDLEWRLTRSPITPSGSPPSTPAAMAPDRPREAPGHEPTPGAAIAESGPATHHHGEHPATTGPGTPIATPHRARPRNPRRGHPHHAHPTSTRPHP